MRYGYWMPVFGGRLRNVEDEGMAPTWEYVKRLALRAERIGFDLTLVNDTMKKSSPFVCIVAGALTACGAFPYPAAAAPAVTTALVSNGGFETGGPLPAGWAADGADATHHLSLTRDDPHTGKQAAKMVADAGATPSYFSFDQYVPVTPGSYTLTAWVKTDQVTGNAGWFYHVYKGHDIVVNDSLNASGALTGWSEVTATLTVPEGADTVQIGTSLYGTGTAYFDDATLTKTPQSAAKISYAAKTPLYQSGTQLDPDVGIGIHVASAQNFQEGAADGFTWVRSGMGWQEGEPTTKGKYDWTKLDQVCAWCKQYHLKPEWLIIYGNTLYGNTCSPEGITAFANFAKAGVAESIAQGFPGTRYEIWNEPENFGWTGLLYNAPNANILTSTQVAQINNATVTAIHAADPKALVCTSAFGSLNTQVYWGKPAFDQGLGSKGEFDAVGLHTYSLGSFYKSTEGKNGNDNPECMMAYNPSNLSADLFQQVTLAMIPSYIPGMKTYWSTESGRQLDNDCANDQNAFASQWVRTTLCQWMAGFQWQALYDLDSDGPWNLQGTQAEKAMKFLLTKTSGRSIAGMSFPKFSATLPPANAIWSLTLSGSPTVRIVWVPEGSASVPVPAGWEATDT